MAEVHEIIDIAMQVNGLCPRKQAVTGDLPTVFIDTYGHVALIKVLVFECGWEAGTEKDMMFEFCTDEPLNAEYFSDYKTYMKKLLERCPQPNEVPNEQKQEE